MRFHNCLRAILRADGIRQIEFANRLGVAQSIISEIASGWRRPTRVLAMRIAQNLGRPLGEVFPGIDEDGE